MTTFKPWLRDETGLPLPCYRSLVPEPPDVEDDCATTGIVGALTGIIGSLQALEVIKEVTGMVTVWPGGCRFMTGSRRARTVKLAWDPENPNNGRASAGRV